MSILKPLLITILYIVLIELGAFWIEIPILLKLDAYHNYFFLIQGAVQLLIVFLLLLIFRKEKINNLITTSDAKWYLLAAGLSVVYLLLQTPLNWLYDTVFKTQHIITYDFNRISKLFNINTIAIILILPLAEELLFRRFIQHDLQKKHNWIFSIVLTSLLFAFMHSPIPALIAGDTIVSWYSTYMTFFGGLLLGYLYHKSKSMGPTLLMHVMWNLGATIL